MSERRPLDALSYAEAAIYNARELERAAKGALLQERVDVVIPSATLAAICEALRCAYLRIDGLEAGVRAEPSLSLPLTEEEATHLESLLCAIERHSVGRDEALAEALRPRLWHRLQAREKP